MKVKYAVLGSMVAGGLLLSGCGVEHKASGLFDEAKGSAAKYKTATRTVQDYKQQCTTKTRQKRNTSGTGKNKRTWYSTESYQDCKRVSVGSHQETYRKKVKDAKYCIELDQWKDSDDDVHNDVWFNVSHSTYLEHYGKNEGDKVKDMKYNHRGC
ncbi:hypothetical protein SEA_LUCKYSOCKE_126 [Streptomyces phage LuckySocke]|jgi:hypothetical protein|nr:hypothetical protein SEA_LUCKYSOCKE_126 [Streptomyces phage LuckySocke]